MSREKYRCPASPSDPFVPSATGSSRACASGREPARWSGEAPKAGLLIMNADDWGRDRQTTDRTFECVLRGTVSSVSAMVFMEDSERAATIEIGRASCRERV